MPHPYTTDCPHCGHRIHGGFIATIVSRARARAGMSRGPREISEEHRAKLRENAAKAREARERKRMVELACSTRVISR